MKCLLTMIRHKTFQRLVHDLLIIDTECFTVNIEDAVCTCCKLKCYKIKSARFYNS